MGVGERVAGSFEAVVADGKMMSAGVEGMVVVGVVVGCAGLGGGK